MSSSLVWETDSWGSRNTRNSVSERSILEISLGGRGGGGGGACPQTPPISNARVEDENIMQILGKAEKGVGNPVQSYFRTRLKTP